MSSSESAPAPPGLSRDSYPRYRWVIAGQLWMHWAIGFIFFQALGVFLPALQQDLGFGAAQAGWLGSLRAVGQLLVFPASLVLVRFNANRLLGVLLTIGTMAMVVQVVAPGLAILMVGMGIHAAAIAWTQIPGAFVRMQWIPTRQMATVQGIQMASGAITAIAMLAGGPYLIDALGWRGALSLITVLLAICAAAWWLLQRERITVRYESAMAATYRWQTIASTVHRKEFWLLGGAIAGGGGAYFTTIIFLPSYLHAERGFSLATAGAIVSMMPLGGLLASLCSGLLSDRLGLRKPFIWSAGLVLPPLYLTMLSPMSASLLWPVAFIVGYFAFAPFVILNAIPFELPDVGPREVAIGQSLTQTIGTLGALVLPIVAGLVASSFDSYRAGLLALVACPATFALVGVFLPETGPRARGTR
ncbi:MAG: MFS transporter [Dehalococcoidia bacterium]|nr:MFS transporter [Dehalococcoidia bacterium]